MLKSILTAYNIYNGVIMIKREYYEVCPAMLKSLSAFVDYCIIFVFVFVACLIFRGHIYAHVNALINSGLDLSSKSYSVPNSVNTDIGGLDDLGMGNIGVGGLETQILQFLSSILSDFKFIFLIFTALQISFWVMVLSFFFSGKTVGSKLFKIKLVMNDNEKIEADNTQRFLRGLIIFLDFFFLFGILTFISVFRRDKRSLAEILSKTITLRKIK